MDPATINTFLDQFLGVINTGFGLIEGDVSFVLNALIAISITLAGAQWALSAEAPIAPFFRKVLFVGLFAFLINNWVALSTAINQSGALLGLRAGGSSLTLPDLHNPGRIAGVGIELFGRTNELGEGLNILTDFVPLVTILVAAFFVMIGFFILALQLFVALISFKLGSLAAFVALPWGVFSGTAWVAERPLGWVVGSAIRLFVLALIASVSITFVDALPATLSLEDGGVLNVMLFGVTMVTLAWFGPQLASEVAMGQPHLSANEGVRMAQGAAASAGGMAVGSRILFGSLGGASAASRSGGRRMRGGQGGRSGGSGGGNPSGGRPAPARPPAINHAAMQPRPRPGAGSQGGSQGGPNGGGPSGPRRGGQQ